MYKLNHPLKHFDMSLATDITNIDPSIITVEPAKSVVRVADGSHIPFDPDNTDYQQYLAWLAEGNQPLPADE